MGDSALHDQMKRDGLADRLTQYLVYRPQEEDWVRRRNDSPIEVGGVGTCIYIKALYVAFTPFHPFFLQRMLTPVSF